MPVLTSRPWRFLLASFPVKIFLAYFQRNRELLTAKNAEKPRGVRRENQIGTLPALPGYRRGIFRARSRRISSAVPFCNCSRRSLNSAPTTPAAAPRVGPRPPSPPSPPPDEPSSLPWLP